MTGKPEAPDDGNAPDPFGFWAGMREMRDAYLEAWAKGSVEFVNTEAYARAMNMMLDAYLNASLPAQQAAQSFMTQALAMYNMPSRAEVASVGERLTHVEMRLDDMDAQADTILQGVQELVAAGIAARLVRVEKRLDSAGTQSARLAESADRSDGRLQAVEQRLDRLSKQMGDLLKAVQALAPAQVQAEPEKPLRARRATGNNNGHNGNERVGVKAKAGEPGGGKLTPEEK